MADHMRAELVHQALAMAIWQRQPAAGLIMHTDRGSQYGADSSQPLLTQHGMQPSMSRKGNCWDNAVAESFFHTLKTALISLEDFDTREQAQTAVFAYIEVFYNRQRCHAANGYLAPLVYERTLKTNEIFCPEKCWHIKVTGAAVAGACVDHGDTGEQAAQEAQAPPRRLEVVKLPEAHHGFVRLPRWWVVERSTAWAARLRRLGRDYEQLAETLAGWHCVAFTILMRKRFVAVLLQHA
jgi:transposase